MLKEVTSVPGVLSRTHPSRFAAPMHFSKRCPLVAAPNTFPGGDYVSVAKGKAPDQEAGLTYPLYIRKLEKVVGAGTRGRTRL